METWVLKRADEVTCICEGIRRDLILRGIDSEKITIIPNAVDANRFQPVGERNSAIEQELNLVDKRVIAFIGSFYDYEGLDLLVSAMPKLFANRYCRRPFR